MPPSRLLCFVRKEVPLHVDLSHRQARIKLSLLYRYQARSQHAESFQSCYQDLSPLLLLRALHRLQIFPHHDGRVRHSDSIKSINSVNAFVTVEASSLMVLHACLLSLLQTDVSTVESVLERVLVDVRDSSSLASRVSSASGASLFTKKMESRTSHAPFGWLLSDRT